jgi:hypothetical protein
MDYNRSIVVIAEKENQAQLFTQLEPIRLSQNRQLAIKSIFHGSVYNINKYNNKVHYQITPIGKQFSEITANEIIEKYFAIPEGNYPNVQSVIEAIADKFSEFFSDTIRYPLPKFEIIQSRKKDDIRIDIRNLRIRVSNRYETPWNLLNIKTDINEDTIIKIENIDFSKWIVPSFLYVNIVESSYINGKLSRNLSIIPLNMKHGWSFYEFKEPLYTPIDVQEFSKIILEIRDMNGNYVTFDPLFRTVITLHISAINTEK